MDATEGSGGGEPDAKYPWWFRTLNLRASAGWDELYKLISGDRVGRGGHGHHRAAQAIIKRLEKHGVCSALVEFPYHDRDFSDEYVAFYARLYRPGRRACTRIHFFTNPSEDLDVVIALNVQDEHKRLGQLRNLAEFVPHGGGYTAAFAYVDPRATCR